MLDWFDKKQSQPEVSPSGSILNRHTKLSAPEIGFVGQSAAEFAKACEDAYLPHFGEAKHVFHEIIPLIPHIDVMEYYRKGKDGMVCTLVTSGMSDLAMRVPPKTEAPRRVELIFAKGVDAVLDLFTKHQHPYVFNPNRPSYV
jgi:hypothetical protein